MELFRAAANCPWRMPDSNRWTGGGCRAKMAENSGKNCHWKLLPSNCFGCFSAQSVAYRNHYTLWHLYIRGADISALLDLRGASHAPRNDSDHAECRGVYITDSVYRLSLLPVPLGPLALLERFDLSTFLETVLYDLMHSFTIDSTRRPLPCVKNLPMGNSRKPEKSGLFI